MKKQYLDEVFNRQKVSQSNIETKPDDFRTRFRQTIKIDSLQKQSMKMNLIQKITISKINQLMDQYDSVKGIKHNPTKGQLRENFLIAFLQEMIPNELKIFTGIICDVKGNASTQLDMIISDESYLPTMNFQGKTAIIPIESTLLFSEVKSTLRKSDFVQIENQIKSVENLVPCKDKNTLTRSESNIMVHNFVVCFDTDVSEKTLIDWVRSTKSVIAVCIIGKFSVLKLTKNEVKAINKTDNTPDYWETLVFLGKLHKGLKQIMQKRNYTPSWDLYMQGVP